MEALTEKIHTSDFRDTLSFSSSNGNRIRIFPKRVTGRLFRWRVVVASMLLLAFFAGPFISINGHPLLLINIVERKFVLFGIPFWPQDLHLIALGLLTFMVFIVLFTVVYGRVWCGWACPQTIFMEMIFRPIENIIEGDYKQQQRLEKQPWNLSKIGKKTLKHIFFITVSLIISHTFMAYILGKDALFELIRNGPLDNLGGFVALIVFTSAFYFVFAKFRELACIFVCPYGRLQGVLLDKKSMVVAYDYKRGEPRGHIKKGEERKKGDCIDCKLCVDVCPTGIDIRNGVQLECVNCTACIDVCNEVMHKIGKPTQLIRYDSLDGIERGKRNIFNTRTLAYSVVLLLLVVIEITLLVTRSEIETTVLRTPGHFYQMLDNNKVSNLYTIELVNKTYTEIPISLRPLTTQAVVRTVGNTPIVVPSNDIFKGAFFIELPHTALLNNNTQIELEVVSGNRVIDVVKTSFMGPKSTKTP